MRWHLFYHTNNSCKLHNYAVKTSTTHTHKYTSTHRRKLHYASKDIETRFRIILRVSVCLHWTCMKLCATCLWWYTMWFWYTTKPQGSTIWYNDDDASLLFFVYSYKIYEINTCVIAMCLMWREVFGKDKFII